MGHSLAQELPEKKPSSYSRSLNKIKDSASGINQQDLSSSSPVKKKVAIQDFSAVKEVIGKDEGVIFDKKKRQLDLEKSFHEALPAKFQFANQRGKMVNMTCVSETHLMPANLNSLKKWGFHPMTAALFSKQVKVSVPKSGGKLVPGGLKVEALLNHFFLQKETLFSVYDLAKKTNHMDIVKILSDSFSAAGTKWIFCKYDWGKNYFGFTFYKEAAKGTKPIEIIDMAFPATFFPLAHQKFNRALVAVWWLEIAEFSESKAEAKLLKDFSSQILEDGP